MLKRKILSTFAAWKSRKNKVALLVKGARLVGKTTSIREFGKSCYGSFIEINFEKTPSARRAFRGDLDARTIIINLSAQGFGPFNEGNTLVFFDEIQSCPAARTAIKFLVEDGKYDFIESGSLLGINYNDVSSYPVGFEEQIDMYPLDFEEFMWANDVAPEVFDLICESYQSLTPVPKHIHEKMTELFYRYLIVGGMPAAVNAFLEYDDLAQTIRVQNIILANYRDDIAKYAGREKDKAKAIFDALPGQLNKKSKRFILSTLERGASTRKYEQATNWLSDAGIAYHCFNVSELALPLAFSQKRNLYKLYMLDTGLLCAMSMNGIQNALLTGRLKINEGMVAENYVAAVFAKKGIPLYYYDKKTRAELDFVFNDGENLSVVEVKSGNDYHRHVALDNAIHDSPKVFGRKIVLCKGNVETDSNILYLPLYMTMLL
jgi:predicted AAA+ superfamily ATPase